MKRPLERHERAAMFRLAGARLVAAVLGGLLAFAVGCTGKIGAMREGPGGAVGSGSGAGTGTGTGTGAGQAGGGPGTGGQGGAAPVSAATPTPSHRRPPSPCWCRRPGWRGSAGRSGRTPCAICSS